MVKRVRRRLSRRGRRTRRRVRSRVRKVSRRRLQAKGVQQLAKAAVVAKGLYDTWAQSGTYRDAGLGRRERRGSRTKKSTLQKSEGTGAYNQWTQRYAQAKFGRLTMRKILNQSVEQSIFVWQKLSRFGTGGTIRMSHCQDNASTPTYTDLPCICFELNSVPNWVNGAKSNYPPLCGLRKAVNGNYIWYSIQGQQPVGSLNANWQVEKSSHPDTVAGCYPQDQSILKWIQLEMELNGCTSQPTKYTIEVCKFNEEVTPNVNIGGSQTDGNYNEFWDNEMKSYTFSPLSQLVPGYKKKKKYVLRRWNVDLDPTASFENDARPHVKTFRVFLRMNTKCTYDWKYATGTGQAPADFEDVDYKQEDNENQNQVDPKARLFLLIRATNYVLNTAPAQITTANTPDMNLRVRACHLMSS